jgi:ubiquinone biosynthesis protein
VRTFALDVSRAGRLLWVALKFGAGPLVRQIFRLPARGPANPVRIRLALEELGLTFLKLGQFLATRFDILPAEFCEELSRLFESVPPMRVEQVVSVIESELGGPVARFFASFSLEPLAAASVAQVHEARTHRGERVAVKVQRPGIAAIFEADMRNLRRVAVFLDRIEVLVSLSLTDVADEFATYTRRELNFITEGETADHVRRHASGFAVIPKILWPLSGSKVLTMEFLDGISIAKLSRRLETEGIEGVRKELPQLDIDRALHNFAFAALHQLFLTGVFHADPHPGNILIRDDNRVAFVDFGIFGRLSKVTRETLARYMESIAAGNIDEAYRYYAKLSVPTAETDISGFQRETKALLSRWYEASRRLDSPVDSRHLGMTISEILKILHRYRLRTGIDTLLFWRAVIALDSSALSLSKQFDLLSEMKQFFAQHRPSVWQRALNMVTDPDWFNSLVELSHAGQKYVRDTLDDTFHGSFHAIFRISESPRARREHNLHAKVLGLALVTTSTFIAGSTVPVAGRPIGLAVLSAAFLVQALSLRKVIGR